MKVDYFSVRIEATCRQVRYAEFLAKSAGTTVQDVAEKLWDMPASVAYSDRPWGRLTRREISEVINYLKGGK